MSRENVEVVRRVYEAAGRRDAEAVLALYDAAVELDSSRLKVVDSAGAGSDVYRGHEGMRRFFREWHEAWENVEYDFDELIDAGGDHVVVKVMDDRVLLLANIAVLRFDRFARFGFFGMSILRLECFWRKNVGRREDRLSPKTAYARIFEHRSIAKIAGSAALTLSGLEPLLASDRIRVVYLRHCLMKSSPLFC